MKVELHLGQRARTLLEDAAFVERWQALAARDPRFTLLQEPAFVRTWFRVYGGAHDPILVTGSAGDELVALMPLALGLRDRRLTHAGGSQAEYHGWIADPDVNDQFPPRALAMLRKAVPFDTWRWRWCPPGTALGWESDSLLVRDGLQAVVEWRPSPVLDLRDGDRLAKLKDNRSLRSKINRYRRDGGYRFERIHDQDRTRQLIDEFARQCDFRQETVNGVRPFADDRHKADFFVRRQDFPEAVHFSVLWNGQRPVAFHLGGCDGRTCLLGASAYAPSDARNSPGTLLLVELASALRAEGYERLDLTPGTDPYKQRFANGEQLLARITLHGTRGGAARTRAATALRGVLRRASSTRNADVQERLARWQRGLRATRREWQARGGAGLLRALGRRARGSAQRCLVRPAAAPEPAIGPREHEVQRQDWRGLAAATDSAGERRTLWARASERFAAGQELFTLPLSDDAGGLVVAWRTAAGAEEAGQTLVTAGLLTDEDTLLHGLEIHGPGQVGPALRDCLATMLRGREGAIALLLEDRGDELDEAAQALGFVPVAVVRRGRALAQDRTPQEAGP
jgi:CelD/BcsL family acetyltransferase involved in cellulose biosynthesis